MTKQELRSLYKAKRKKISVIEKDKLEDLMLIRFQNLGLAIPDVVMSFSPSHKLAEFDPYLTERYCFLKNPAVSFCYPVVAGEGEMDAVLPDEASVNEPNRYGIDEPVDGALVEPADIELVFIPLLAFDEAGYRVGYGKAYYDRFLKRCKPATKKVGFSFFEAEPSIDDLDEFDIPLDYCITPTKFYSFKA